IKWNPNGWIFTPDGVHTGQKLLSCRPATTVKWVHEHLWTPGTRFILTGSSGGASQIAYSMMYLFVPNPTPNFVDLLLLDSGPPIRNRPRNGSRCERLRYWGSSVRSSDIGRDSHSYANCDTGLRPL